MLTHTNAGVDPLRRRLRVFGAPAGQVRVETIASWAHSLVQHYPKLARVPVSERGSDSETAPSGDQLQEFRRRWPVLQPLLVPLKLTILVVPPRQGKDLDNIALDILPIAHTVLRPHIDPWLMAPALSEDADREARIRRLGSLNAMSVTSYQVIELQRSPGGRDVAMLRLALGLGDRYDSPWAR